MSDNTTLAATLGYMAGSYAGNETANAVNQLLFATRSNNQTVSIEVVRAAASEMEQLVEQKDAYIAALQREISELRAYAKKVEAERNTLLDWTEKAEAELRWRRSVE